MYREPTVDILPRNIDPTIWFRQCTVFHRIRRQFMGDERQ
jgi:hypothetical protein